MISEAELRRHAVTAGVDTMVQDLDYGLGWFLAGLFTQTRAAQYLVFKGGTCLRKWVIAIIARNNQLALICMIEDSRLSLLGGSGLHIAPSLAD